MFDNPGLLACCVIGDGEAETGALAASWHSNKFLEPARDGAVLPILHLNGYKIAGPTVLARIGDEELVSLLRGYGHEPYFVSGHEPADMHQQMAAALDRVLDDIARIQRDARDEGVTERPRWPMIVLRSPKGWTGPRVVDGKQTEGTWRSHQVPLAGLADNPEHLRLLEQWMKSYRPEELFDESGALVPELAELAPDGRAADECQPARQRWAAAEGPRHARLSRLRRRGSRARRRCSARRHACSAACCATCCDSTRTRATSASWDPTRRRPTVSTRCSRSRTGSPQREILESDEHVSRDGRVMEVLSEQLCQGWLEGYLLTGRHGLFSCYEAFIHIVDSMFNQHAKWLKTTRHIPWRKPIASLNYLLTSHVWRQDHNGASHQDPGFIDHVVNKKADVVRVYLPPDTNTLLSVADHCLRSRHYVNVIVAGKQPAPQWLDIEAAAAHCARGLGVWEWASNDDGDPDVVLACAGDVPTMETLAAVDLLRTHVPGLRMRVVNVVDLMTLQPSSEHPHGLPDDEFDEIFTRDRPIVFAFHGYPWLIHRLAYRRTNHRNLHVRGFKEEGTTTTPFDMTVLNDIDRFHLALDVLARVARLRGDATADAAAAYCRRRLDEHRQYVTTRGDDMPDVRDWRWPAEKLREHPIRRSP